MEECYRRTEAIRREKARRIKKLVGAATEKRTPKRAASTSCNAEEVEKNMTFCFQNYSRFRQESALDGFAASITIFGGGHV